MKIIEKKLTEIEPYERNPRKNDAAVEYVANSIKEFGFKVPIVVDKDGVIIAGHTRYKAARKLHLDTVPVLYADDLNDEQVKAFRLADNKVSEKAEWDFLALDRELSELNIDLSNFGFENFDESYIDNLIDEKLHEQNNEKSLFEITFAFDKKYETAVKDYIKLNGKEFIVDMILRGAGV